jgi:hypothetical protein
VTANQIAAWCIVGPIGLAMAWHAVVAPRLQRRRWNKTRAAKRLRLLTPAASRRLPLPPERRER